MGVPGLIAVWLLRDRIRALDGKDTRPPRTSCMTATRRAARGERRLIDELLKFFVVLFVVVEPPSLVPVFASMTAGASPEYGRRMAVKASVIAAIT